MENRPKITLDIVNNASDEAMEHDAPETTADILRRRFRQSSASRLSEYITGLPLESPDISERIHTDHHIIRGKYGLPELHARTASPGWYENYLRNIALQEGVEIVHPANCGTIVADEAPSEDEGTPSEDAAIVRFWRDRKTIGLAIDKNLHDRYIQSLAHLEHEIIHVLQSKRTPSMPIELMEYEAYVAEGRFSDIGRVFERIHKSSSFQYDRVVGADTALALREWDKAEFFLELVDGISLNTLSSSDQAVLEKMKLEREWHINMRERIRLLFLHKKALASQKSRE